MESQVNISSREMEETKPLNDLHVKEYLEQFASEHNYTISSIEQYPHHDCYCEAQQPSFR